MKPFGRSISLAAAISAIYTMANPVNLQRSMLEALPQYVSRGKGKGKSNQHAAGAGMASKRAAMKKRRKIAHRRASR